MMLKLKEELVRYGRVMAARRLTSGSGGNLSVMDRSQGRMAITPSGMDYDALGADDIVICDGNGKTVEGHRQPSSELAFHLALYGCRKDIHAVVHTHSVYATTLSCLQREIPAVHYLIGYAGSKVPLASYATVGSEELAHIVARTIGDSNAVLLANHGLVAVGEDLRSAFTVAEEIEFVARVYYQALLIGEPQILTAEQMQEVLVRFKTYGKQKRDNS